MGKFYQCIQSYGPSFMTKLCSALYLENLLTKFAWRGIMHAYSAFISLFEKYVNMGIKYMYYALGAIKSNQPRCDTKGQGDLRPDFGLMCW